MAIYTGGAFAQWVALNRKTTECEEESAESAATVVDTPTEKDQTHRSEPKQPPESYFLDVKITPLDNIGSPNPSIPRREPTRGPPGFLYPVRKQAPAQRQLEKLYLHRSPEPGVYDFAELPPLERHEKYARIQDESGHNDGVEDPTLKQFITTIKNRTHKKEFDRFIMSQNLIVHGPARMADRVSALRQRTAEEDTGMRTRVDVGCELLKNDILHLIPLEVRRKWVEEKKERQRLMNQERERKAKRKLEIIEKMERDERDARRAQQARYDREEKEKQQQKRCLARKRRAEPKDSEMSDDESGLETDMEEREVEKGGGSVTFPVWQKPLSRLAKKMRQTN